MGNRPCTDAEQNEMSAFVKVLREAMVELEAKVILSLQGPPFFEVHPGCLEPFLSPEWLSFSWNCLLTEPASSHRTRISSSKLVSHKTAKSPESPRLLRSLASQIPPSSPERHFFESPFLLPQGPSGSLSNGARYIPLRLPLLCSLAPPRVAGAQPHPLAPPQNAGAARGSAAERGRAPSV